MAPEGVAPDGVAPGGTTPEGSPEDSRPAGDRPADAADPPPRGPEVAVLADWARQAGVDCEPTSDARQYVVQLPGEAKLKTTVVVRFGDYSVRLLAFVVRKPDERAEDFFRWLLTRNGRLHGIGFMIDSLGDVYLVGELPRRAFTADACDAVMGEILSASDGSFNELLRLGFMGSMRREWAWRVSRGESTANLEALLTAEDRAAAERPEP